MDLCKHAIRRSFGKQYYACEGMLNEIKILHPIPIKQLMNKNEMRLLSHWLTLSLPLY